MKVQHKCSQHCCVYLHLQIDFRTAILTVALQIVVLYAGNVGLVDMTSPLLAAHLLPLCLLLCMLAARNT